MHSLIGILAIGAFLVTPSGRLWQSLQSHLRLSSAELSAIDRGEVVSKLPASTNAREVAAFGIIQVDADGDTLLSRFRNITNFKKSDQVLEIGKFSSPPALTDLAGLTLDREEALALRSCDVGRCDVRLSKEMMARLRRGSAGDPAALFRQVLLDYLNSYIAAGSGALIRYDDKSPAMSLAEDFQNLLGASPYLRDYSPEFSAYLQSYPQNKPQGVEDFFYWSKEKFGLKPVISLTHVFMYRHAETSDVLIVSKQVYASHYFDSSMGITAFIAGSGRGSPSYLAYLNRSRVDALGGSFGGVVSSLIRRQVQDGLTANLKLTKQRLETR